MTEEEFGRLMEHLPLDLAPAIAFLYTTGWRIGDVRNLKRSAVNFRPDLASEKNRTGLAD